MARKTTYDSYSDTYKAIAVELGNLEGVKSKDIAEVLEIHPVMLYRWKKEYRDGVIMKRTEPSQLEAKASLELKRLKKIEKAHERLLQQHDILKKSTPYFLAVKKKSSRT